MFRGDEDVHEQYVTVCFLFQMCVAEVPPVLTGIRADTSSLGLSLRSVRALRQMRLLVGLRCIGR